MYSVFRSVLGFMIPRHKCTSLHNLQNHTGLSSIVSTLRALHEKNLKTHYDMSTPGRLTSQYYSFMKSVLDSFINSTSCHSTRPAFIHNTAHLAILHLVSSVFIHNITHRGILSLSHFYVHS